MSAACAASAYVATGHGEHGVLMALSGGKALAQLILEDEGQPTSFLDLTPFDAQRFG